MTPSAHTRSTSPTPRAPKILEETTVAEARATCRAAPARPDDDARHGQQRSRRLPRGERARTRAPLVHAKASYLETFSREAGEEAPPADLTKAQASERIDALQQQTGRGA